MSAIQLVKSERGRDHVFLNGFTFRKAYYHSTVGGWKWRCTNKKCSANMYLDNELSIMPGSSYEHNHSPLSRKRQNLKDMVLMEPFIGAASDPAAAVPVEEAVPTTNGHVEGSEPPKSGGPANGVVPKKRSRGAGTVRRKRQKKLPPLQSAPEGTHHLAEDQEFELDQCDSSTVFVNIFENQAQSAAQVSRLPAANPTVVVEEQPENFDPLSESFRTAAFPAICDLSLKEEAANPKNDVVSLDEEDEGGEVEITEEDADDDCFLYEDVSLHRNVRVYPSHNLEPFKSASSRALCLQSQRARSMQGSIDLNHPIDTFFFAMAQSVKRLSTVNQIKAKQMITKLITKFEMDEVM